MISLKAILLSCTLWAQEQVPAGGKVPTDMQRPATPATLEETAPQSVMPGYQIPRINSASGSGACRRDMQNMINRGSSKSIPKIDLEKVLSIASRAGANEDLVRRVMATYLENKDKIANKRFVSFADFSKPQNAERFFVIDLESGKIKKYKTSHGKGSDKGSSGRVKRFSNEHKSNATSEGCSLTGSVYRGKHGPSLRMHGFEKTNDNNCPRAVVMHSANYMERGRTGRSWGCLVFSKKQREEIIGQIKEGSLTCNFSGARPAMVSLLDSQGDLE